MRITLQSVKCNPWKLFKKKNPFQCYDIRWTTATVNATIPIISCNSGTTKLLTSCHSPNSMTSTLLNPYRINFRGPFFFIFDDPSLHACDVVSMGKHGTKQSLTQYHIPADTAVIDTVSHPSRHCCHWHSITSQKTLLSLTQYHIPEDTAVIDKVSHPRRHCCQTLKLGIIQSYKWKYWFKQHIKIGSKDDSTRNTQYAGHDTQC